jgi:hypothetical protein
MTTRSLTVARSIWASGQVATISNASRLGARHLDDAHAALKQLDELGHGAGVEGAAEVAGVLVEQAMGDEHHLPAAGVGETSRELGFAGSHASNRPGAERAAHR